MKKKLISTMLYWIISINSTLVSAQTNSVVNLDAQRNSISLAWENHKKLIGELTFYTLLDQKLKTIRAAYVKISSDEAKINNQNLTEIDYRNKYNSIINDKLALKAVRKDFLEKNKGLYQKSFPNNYEEIFSNDSVKFINDFTTNTYIHLDAIVDTSLDNNPNSKKSLPNKLIESRKYLVEIDPRFKTILPIFESKQKIKILSTEVSELNAKANMQEKIVRDNNFNSGFTFTAVYFIELAALVALGFYSGLALATILTFSLLFNPLAKISGHNQPLSVFWDLPLIASKKIHGLAAEQERLYAIYSESKLKNEALNLEKEKLSSYFSNNSQVANRIDQYVISGQLDSAILLSRP